MQRVIFYTIISVILQAHIMCAMDENDQLWLNDSLSFATRSGNKAKVAALIHEKAQVNALDDLGNAPLHYASQRSASLVDLLVRNGANVHIAHPARKVTPLHMAVWCGNKGAAVALVQAGASLTAVDKNGVTPLTQKTHHSISNEQREDVIYGCLAAVALQEVREKYINIKLASACEYLGEQNVDKRLMTTMIVENMISELCKERDKHKVRLKKPTSCKRSCVNCLLLPWYIIVKVFTRLKNE